MKKYAIFAWIIVVIWMLVIYSFSAKIGDESSSDSRKVVQGIVDVVEKDKTKEEKKIIVDKIHNPFRKFAHAFEYFILCILLVIALLLSGVKKYLVYIIAVSISIIYSMSDELHQILIAGRSGEIRDCFIDIFGAIIGCLLCILISKIYELVKRD